MEEISGNALLKGFLPQFSGSNRGNFEHFQEITTSL